MKKTMITCIAFLIGIISFAKGNSKIVIYEFPDNYKFQETPEKSFLTSNQLISDADSIQVFFLHYVEKTDKGYDEMRKTQMPMKTVFGVDSASIVFIFDDFTSSKEYHKYFVVGEELDDRTPQNLIAFPINNENGDTMKMFAQKRASESLLSNDEIISLDQATSLLAIGIQSIVLKTNISLLMK